MSDERQRLLDLVRARLVRFNDGHDVTLVLSAEATAEVSALLAAIGDPASDLEVAHAAGWLYWGRYLALGDSGAERQALETALSLLAPVYQARPEAVPEPLRAFFAARTPCPPGVLRCTSCHRQRVSAAQSPTGSSSTRLITPCLSRGRSKKQKPACAGF